MSRDRGLVCTEQLHNVMIMVVLVIVVVSVVVVVVVICGVVVNIVADENHNGLI